MKVLTSHRDEIFKKWVVDFVVEMGKKPTQFYFDYIDIRLMQRGDTTPESQAWLKKNKNQNDEVKEFVNQSIPKDGMISPLILITIKHWHWDVVRECFWNTIPFVIHTGNNRYQYALANNYTHIGSIVIGPHVDPRVWNYLQIELRKPLNKKLKLNKFVLEEAEGINRAHCYWNT